MRTFELNRHADILSFGRQVCQAEPQSVWPKLLDHVEWIDSVTLGFRHRLAVPIQNLRMDKNLLKGNLTHIIDAHQDHTGDPQRDNIPARNKSTGWVKAVQRSVFFWPTKCTVRPQCRTKPGVQNIFFTLKTALL